MPNAPSPRRRPPVFPPPEFPPRRLPLFARTPPAVFPAILGLIGLGLALRRGSGLLGLPQGLAEALLGAVALLWLFAALAYAVKIARRPGVLVEDLRVLPGRAGLAAGTMGLMALAAVLAPYGTGLARAAILAGLALHGGLALLLAWLMLRGPAELRALTPAWHLSFVGFIVAGLAAPAVGWLGLAEGLLWLCGPVALGIGLASLVQLARRIPPAPLRPLLAIHVAPPALLGLVALSLGKGGLAEALAFVAAALALALAGFARWVTRSGPSPLWAAFTFPLTALAALALSLEGGWSLPGTLLLALALGGVPLIAYRVLKGWASGDLAARTNAATA
jgi:tellurite resistance protein